MVTFNTNEYFGSVFRAVIREYERASREVTPSCLTDYVANPHSGTDNTRSPLPNALDFKADVELAAKAVLTVDELQYFLVYYLDQDEAWALNYMRKVRRDRGQSFLSQEYRAFTSDLITRVGREFKSRSIYPVTTYMYAPSKSTARSFCKCGNDAHSASKDSEIWCRGGCRMNMAFHTPKDWVFGADVLQLWCEPCALARQAGRE